MDISTLRNKFKSIAVKSEPVAEAKQAAPIAPVPPVAPVVQAATPVQATLPEHIGLNDLFDMNDTDIRNISPAGTFSRLKAPQIQRIESATTIKISRTVAKISTTVPKPNASKPTEARSVSLNDLLTMDANQVERLFN